MLTKKELADHYKVSESTINRLLKKGMPHVKFGGQVRFKLEEVEEWINK